MLFRYFPALVIVDVVFAVVAVQHAVVQRQSYVVVGGLKVFQNVISLAAEVNAVQTGEQLRSRPATLVAHARESLRTGWEDELGELSTRSKGVYLLPASLFRNARSKTGVHISEVVAPVVSDVRRKV